MTFFVHPFTQDDPGEVSDRLQYILGDQAGMPELENEANEKELSGTQDLDVSIVDSGPDAQLNRVESVPDPLLVRVPSQSNLDPVRKEMSHTFTSLFTQNTKSDNKVFKSDILSP